MNLRKTKLIKLGNGKKEIPCNIKKKIRSLTNSGKSFSKSDQIVNRICVFFKKNESFMNMKFL